MIKPLFLYPYLDIFHIYEEALQSFVRGLCPMPCFADYQNWTYNYWKLDWTAL